MHSHQRYDSTPYARLSRFTVTGAAARSTRPARRSTTRATRRRTCTTPATTCRSARTASSGGASATTCPRSATARRSTTSTARSCASTSTALSPRQPVRERPQCRAGHLRLRPAQPVPVHLPAQRQGDDGGHRFELLGGPGHHPVRRQLRLALLSRATAAAAATSTRPMPTGTTRSTAPPRRSRRTPGPPSPRLRPRRLLRRLQPRDIEAVSVRPDLQHRDSPTPSSTPTRARSPTWKRDRTATSTSSASSRAPSTRSRRPGRSRPLLRRPRRRAPGWPTDRAVLLGRIERPVREPAYLFLGLRGRLSDIDER